MLNRKVFVLLFIGVLVSELLVSNVEAGKGDGSSKDGKKGSQNLGNAANLPSLDQVRTTLQQYATRIRDGLRGPNSNEEVDEFHAWRFPQYILELEESSNKL
ncbi:uncharacterized protein LOC116338092 [Contarinia nasturtii]|uniref:uncharacterized protein LOC116338092 n=1 Tax=Contarinia nasturtii TaxID=265458 RepID=UPI0012D39E30|nr:uncharacterized protein LOC116338092 [Contarinia nasturtii]